MGAHARFLLLLRLHPLPPSHAVRGRCPPLPRRVCCRCPACPGLSHARGNLMGPLVTIPQGRCVSATSPPDVRALGVQHPEARCGRPGFTSQLEGLAPCPWETCHPTKSQRRHPDPRGTVVAVWSCSRWPSVTRGAWLLPSPPTEALGNWDIVSAHGHVITSQLQCPVTGAESWKGLRQKPQEEDCGHPGLPVPLPGPAGN